MTKSVKHVGSYGEKKCVVVFREVPNEPDNCLLVVTDGLDGRTHDELMQVVESDEAQEANELSEVLNRRQFSDGALMLTSLHYGKKLSKVPTQNVDLIPLPNQRVNLAEVNAELRKIMGGEPAPKTDSSHLEKLNKPLIDATIDDVEAAKAQMEAERAQTEPSQAESLKVQAELMKEDAASILAEADAKLEQAYQLDPNLRPKKRGRKPKAKAE